ncbi:MAG: hypothetical protein U0575_15925 [Phycisphaerales bacterium]
MIDLSFLLIVFFIVVSRTSGREIVKLLLPRPEAPQSHAADEKQRVVVDVLGRADEPAVVAGVRGGTDFAADTAGRRAAPPHTLASLYRGVPERRASTSALIAASSIDTSNRCSAPVADGAASTGVPPRVNW